MRQSKVRPLRFRFGPDIIRQLAEHLRNRIGRSEPTLDHLAIASQNYGEPARVNHPAGETDGVPMLGLRTRREADGADVNVLRHDEEA